MLLKLIMTSVLFPWLSMAQLPTAATPLTDAIAHVESSFGKRMRSADGTHNGWHMMGRAAWKDVDAQRKAKGLPVHKYSECTDYAVSSLYCYDYLEILRGFPHLSDDYVLARYRGGRNSKVLDPLKTYAKYIKAVKSHIPTPK